MSDILTDLKHGPDNGRNSEGAFATLRDGRLIFVYTRYNTAAHDDPAHADLAALYSSDGGRTWGGQRIVVPNRKQNVMSVSLLRLQDGRLAMAYLEKSFKDRQLQKVLPDDPGVLDCRPYFCVSDDDGATWSPPVDICRTPPTYAILNNDRLVQLKSGRLILPVSIHRPLAPRVEEGKPVANVYARRAETFFFLSDDGGATWREASQCCYGPQGLSSGLREPGVVELADGRLMAWFRTNGGCQYKAFSGDGGETWSTPQPAPEFPSDESPLTMKRDPKTGELVAVWCDLDPRWGIRPEPSSWRRTPLVIARSRDEGATWQNHRLLEDAPDHGFCYIAMHFADDALLLAYCCGGGTDSTVLQDLRIRRIEN